MDDILIASKGTTTIEDHRAAVHDVLQVLQDYDLFLKPKKCVWESPRVDYLGLILEKGVTRMDPAKITGVRDWPTPTTVKQVRSFLGFCNFYRAFIRGFSHLAKPLNNLMKKDTPWTWGEEQQTTFDTLRERIISEPVLIQPDLSKPFEIEVDSSGFARGAVLLQWGKDNKKHPVAFYSQTLTDAEQNYPIKDLEFSAIVYALLHWRPFLAGSPHDIIVHTDHANLTAWTQPQKISCRVARLVQALEEFPMIRHVSPYPMKLRILYVFHSFHAFQLFPSFRRFSALFCTYPLSRACRTPSGPLSCASHGSRHLSHASADIPAP